MRKTFDLPITSSGVYQEVKSKKLPVGFKPLVQAYLNNIKDVPNITQNQLRNMYSPQGEPRLYHKRGQPGPVIMNAQLRDYKTEENMDEVEKIKREKEQKYLHSTGRTDALFNVPEVDAQITKVNKALDRLVGVSKEEKEELRKALLTDIVGKNLNVIKKYQLREMTDPNGNVIKNVMARLPFSSSSSSSSKESDDEKYYSFPPEYEERDEETKRDAKKRLIEKYSSSSYQISNILKIYQDLYRKKYGKTINQDDIKNKYDLTGRGQKQRAVNALADLELS